VVEDIASICHSVASIFLYPSVHSVASIFLYPFSLTHSPTASTVLPAFGSKDPVGFDEVSRRYASGAWLPQQGAKGFRV